MARMHPRLPKGVTVDRDYRSGKPRYYFRAPGRPKVRLREEPGTPEFDQEVACARLGIPYQRPGEGQQTTLDRSASPGSFQWLVQQYKARAINLMAPDQLARRVRLLEEICESRTSSGKRRGDLPFKLMERKHVIEIRDTLRSTAGAQNNLCKYLSAFFGWAIKVGLAEHNPCQGIERLKTGGGWHTWTVDEVRRFERRHPPGTKAHLYLYLALFTGLRLQELAILGRQHIKNGWLKITPGKTRKSSGVEVEIPVLPILQREIDAHPSNNMTFMVTDHGKPFTVNGLGNKMRQWCDEAGLPHCSTHGLRKAGASIAAENGATDEELMAIFGWVTKQQTTHYTKKADRKRMAANAIHKLIPEHIRDKNVPHD